MARDVDHEELTRLSFGHTEVERALSMRIDPPSSARARPFPSRSTPTGLTSWTKKPEARNPNTKRKWNESDQKEGEDREKKKKKEKLGILSPTVQCLPLHCPFSPCLGPWSPVGWKVVLWFTNQG